MGKGFRKQPEYGFNPKVAKLEVTKLQIVQRELDTCSDLYFSFGDLVSIHLLASAAHEILAAHDAKVLKTGMLFDHPEQSIKSERLDDYRDLMKRPFIGFKHGQADLKSIVELPNGMTEILLLSGILKYSEITQRPTARMMLLESWILLHRNLLTEKAAEMVEASAIRKRFPPYARGEFREACFPVCMKLAGQDTGSESLEEILRQLGVVPQSETSSK